MAVNRRPNLDEYDPLLSSFGDQDGEDSCLPDEEQQRSLKGKKYIFAIFAMGFAFMLIFTAFNTNGMITVSALLA